MAKRGRPKHEIEYEDTLDCMMIRFQTPRSLITDGNEGESSGVCVGLDRRSGKVSMLSVVGFLADRRYRSQSLKTFLERYGVTIPDRLVREALAKSYHEQPSSL